MADKFDYNAKWNLSALTLAFEDVKVTCRHWRDKEEDVGQQMFCDIGIEGVLNISGEKPLPILVFSTAQDINNVDAQRKAASNAVRTIERQYGSKLPFEIRELSKALSAMPRFTYDELDRIREDAGFYLS